MSRRIKQLRYKDIPPLRERLLRKQNYICPICKRDIKKPVLDHQHKKRIGGTGRLRMVICSNCNVLLGKVENNSIRYNVSQKELPDVLEGMASYLRKAHLPYLHPSESPKSPKLKKASYNKLKKAVNGNQKIPPYPKSKKLTKQLSILFKKYGITPEFYKR